MHDAKVYAAHGLPVIERHGIRRAGHCRNEPGDRSRVVHFRRCASAAERLSCDAAPDRQARRRETAETIVGRNRTMPIPLRCSPLQ